MITDAEKLALMSDKVDILLARQVAVEALIEHLIVPVFLATIPQLALDLVAAARDMDVKLRDGHMKFMVEEHINGIIDRLEHRIRSQQQRDGGTEAAPV